MKITIESTEEIVEIARTRMDTGVPARVWKGVTESGIVVAVLITRIAVALEADHSQFEKELQETAAPVADAPRVFPRRMIL
jgi:hypothetical protein